MYIIQLLVDFVNSYFCYKCTYISYIFVAICLISERNQIISANTIIECIEKAQEELFYKNEQNEIVGIDLRLKALVAKAKKIEDCEPEFLRFARDNNLDIILI